MITKYKFDSKNPGKKVLILGSVHGDEHCGTKGIELLREALINSEVSLEVGSITCIPYANFEAYKKDTRYIEENLNRVFGMNGNSKEEKIAEYIKEEIKKHDFILDLHSFSSGKEPFVFHDMPGNTLVDTVIKKLPIDYVMTGWVDMYEEVNELDTIGYTKKQGKDGIIIECGEHKNPYAVSFAYNYILSVLDTLGLIQIEKISSEKQKWIHVDTIIHKTKGSEFIKKWKNFDSMKKGEVIGELLDGEKLIAPYDGYILLPSVTAKVGTEWLYFGK